MKGSEAKVLRLNLQVSDEIHTPFFSASSSPTRGTGEFQEHRMKHSTPVSSPEEPGISHSRIRREGLLGSSDEVTSVFRVYGQNPLFEGVNRTNYREIEIHNDLDEHLGAHDTHGEKLITSRKPISPIPSDNESVFWIPQNHVADEKPLRNSRKNTTYPTSKTLLDSFVEHDIDIKTGRNELKQSHQKDYMAQSNIMSTVSLGRTSSIPPPLCSFCQHKTPVFGKPPRQFAYGELEEATNGFSDTNILAEGGFGVVYRGLLRHGQVIAVKLLKFGGSQADTDFCREVRVLSCAQHRNVVLLIGFCVDRKMRFLVYEYVCNGSLDFHLHGNQTPLDWHSRQKIAIGTARGLRYLHEDCRVGCIVHRDMRPHNVLLTHDFEPLVADFGLARWYSECSMSTEERVIGTSGYLAPEYVDGGIISEKVDVYAFGLVLLELITGRRPSELQLYEGRHFLANYWSQPRDSLERNNTFADIYQLLDPFLASDQLHNFTHQLHAMVRAASLCLSRDPESRPPMSKVLRILEGGNMSISMAIDLDTVGNRSGHLRGLSTLKQPETRRSHSRRLSH